MATFTTIAVLARNVRMLDTGTFNLSGKPVLPATANGDRQVLFTFPNDCRITSCHLRVPATLGGAATVKLQRNRAGVYTDITAISVAATAGVASGAGLVPLDVLAGDSIEVLVGGGALTGGQAGVEYDILAQHS